MIRWLGRTFVYRAPREVLACPACRSPRLFELDLLVLRRVIDGSRTGFVSGCDECGLVFVNPLPSAEDLAGFYAPGGTWHADRTPDTAASGQTQGTGWIRWFEPMRGELAVDAPPPGARVLDFGCGAGTLLDALKARGWDTWGIETATDVAFDRHGRLESIPRDASFDLIVCHHVLEHVADPIAILRQFAAAAKPDGYLLVSVPRLDTLPDHRDYYYVINGRAHITAYTWACMHGLLARTGWEPVAPPPPTLSRGRTKQTSARMRVIARRSEGRAVPSPAAPAEEARRAVRRYLAGIPDRSMAQRLRWYRLAARQAEARRLGEARARRAARRRMVL